LAVDNRVSEPAVPGKGSLRHEPHHSEVLANLEECLTLLTLDNDMAVLDEVQHEGDCLLSKPQGDQVELWSEHQNGTFSLQIFHHEIKYVSV
jgi:hypothetical protein